MAGPALSSGPDSPRVAELDRALDQIGVTRSHHTIIFLILIGCLFDAFEQNAVGIVGPMLREQWGLTAADIGMLNTATFASAAVGRILSGLIADRWGRRTMLTVDLLLFTFGAGICAAAPNLTVMALVNINVDPTAAPSYGLATRTITRLEGHERKVGERVPAVAVTGRRSTHAQTTWDQISPMPIAWGTPDKATVARAEKEIPADLWALLEKNIDKVDDVATTRYDLLPL